MAKKKMIMNLTNQLKIIENRIRSGNIMFGDHRRIKDLKEELAKYQ